MKVTVSPLVAAIVPLLLSSAAAVAIPCPECLTARHDSLDLFGGSTPWNASEWTSQDDSVRNGTSVSHLTILPDAANADAAEFSGTLNFLTGPRPDAGFASQRTIDAFTPVNITGYDAILIETLSSDGKVYALTLKDNVPPRNDQASVSFEYDFTPPVGPGKSLLALADFNATYQGSIVDVPPLNTSAVLRFAFMMRSFFGAQNGPFNLTIKSVSAVRLDQVTLEL